MVIGQVLTKMSQQGLSRALRTWCAWAMDAGDRKRSVRRALRRMQRKVLSAAFDTWCTMAGESARLNAAAVRVVSRCWNRMLLSAYSQWRSRWEMWRLVGHVVARLSMWRMAQCFSRWGRALELWTAESNAARQAESMALLRSDLVAQQQSLLQFLVVLINFEMILGIDMKLQS